MSPQVDAWVMTLEPSSPSEIVGWEMGARTCLHVRPGSLTILECRFNKTTHHHQKSPPLRFGCGGGGAHGGQGGGLQRPRARGPCRQRRRSSARVAAAPRVHARRRGVRRRCLSLHWRRDAATQERPRRTGARPRRGPVGLAGRKQGTGKRAPAPTRDHSQVVSLVRWLCSSSSRCKICSPRSLGSSPSSRCRTRVPPASLPVSALLPC